MSLYNGPPRPGARGGKDQFSWDNVKSDKDREYYLGHSVKALTGRWQKGRDVYWYTKEKQDNFVLQDEIQAVKAREEQLMLEALGLKPKSAPQPQSQTFTKNELDEIVHGRRDHDQAPIDEKEKFQEEQDREAYRTKGLGYSHNFPSKAAGDAKAVLPGDEGVDGNTLKQGSASSHFPPPPPLPSTSAVPGRGDVGRAMMEKARIDEKEKKALRKEEKRRRKEEKKERKREKKKEEERRQERERGKGSRGGDESPRTRDGRGKRVGGYDDERREMTHSNGNNGGGREALNRRREREDREDVEPTTRQRRRYDDERHDGSPGYSRREYDEGRRSDKRDRDGRDYGDYRDENGARDGRDGWKHSRRDPSPSSGRDAQKGVVEAQDRLVRTRLEDDSRRRDGGYRGGEGRQNKGALREESRYGGRDHRSDDDGGSGSDSSGSESESGSGDESDRDYRFQEKPRGGRRSRSRSPRRSRSLSRERYGDRNRRSGDLGGSPGRTGARTEGRGRSPDADRYRERDADCRRAGERADARDHERRGGERKGRERDDHRDLDDRARRYYD